MGICFSSKKNIEYSNEIGIIYTNIDENENIKKIIPITVQYFSWKGKSFYAKPCHIYDGDTFSICWIWKGEIVKYRCRCLGYDSPEIKPLKTNLNRDHEKNIANISKLRFTELLFANPSGLVKVECDDFDKYGRILVTVYNEIDNKSINQIMLDEGHGKVYDGGKKSVW
jgi:endonuclease YncB( thermonuclease family)